jgi:hypothetical protein
MQPWASVQAVYFTPGGLNPPDFPECSATSKYLEKPAIISPARVLLNLGEYHGKENFTHHQKRA